jgi:CO/xanthine dehydrogenase FAD-binding subunit
VRGLIAPLEHVRPRTLHDALRILRDDPDVVPLAGATDLYVSLNFGTLKGQRFLDIWHLRSLRRIADKGDILSVGALATFSAIIASRAVRSRIPMLVAAAREIGGVQIQNRGTLGGNVANASPAADTLPVLAAAEATVLLLSRAGERRVPITSYYTGYRTSVKRSDELIAAIEIPRLDASQYFRKVGTRAAQAISKVVMAAIRGGTPRIALGSVAPTVVRLPRTESALGQGASVEDAVRVLESEIHPIDDVRSTAAYRLRVAGNLLRECFGPPSA